MSFGGGGFFGSGASQSESFGGPTSSSDTFANNNAYASAPILNLSDSRQSSGKYVTQAANQYNVAIQNTDYGALAAAADFYENAAEMGSLAINSSRDALGIVAQSAGSFLKDTLDSHGDTFKLSVDAISDNNRRSNQLITDAIDYTAAMIKVGNQSEGMNLTEQFLAMAPKVLLIGGGLYVVAKILPRVIK